MAQVGDPFFTGNGRLDAQHHYWEDKKKIKEAKKQKRHDRFCAFFAPLTACFPKAKTKPHLEEHQDTLSKPSIACSAKR